MIVNNGHEWATLRDEIMYDNKQIIAVYAGDKLVYPSNRKLRYAMWFGFDYIISEYDPRPVNEYGVYLDFDEREKPIYRTACYLNINTTPYRRALYATMRNFEAADYTLKYVPYVADNSLIIADGYNHASGGIRIYSLSEHSNGQGAYYYVSPVITVNLVDDQGNYLLDYQKTHSSENCPIFYSEQECLRYIGS